ncbi:hypothetical protein AB9P05_15055 [Roseivirga sp. BDSF3-8]|uniref:hypothetical protein n=1 Tax=Roseivirga sp. BDSF3-8 TaxID=3241598 RepID=UPI0035326DBB
MKNSNIVHQYFKKELEEVTILVQVDPNEYKGMELLIFPDGTVEKTKRHFDEEIFDDLAEDGFEPGSPLEFNLYLKGIGKGA